MKTEELILAWTTHPFSPEIQEEAKKALADFKAGLATPLTDAYSMPLEFGTGGIRGKIGNGIGQMNVYTVGRAALGFSRYLVKKSKKPILVVAYDSRRMSKEFAETTAGIAASLGIKVHIFKEVAPTPMLSYAVRHYKADGGVVITASHNPPAYNGFKAYLNDGGQLVPPDDSKIIKSIESIHKWKDIQFLPKSSPVYKKMVQFVDKKCFETYLKDISKSGIISKTVKPKDRASLSLVYSPLHGTGGKYMKDVLNKFGYKNVFLVPEEKEPNGEFPTVKYPNPEEEAALAYCLKHSKVRKAHAFIATDPDADRLGIGIRNPQGEYTLLNGNQIGSIMAAYLCEMVFAQSLASKKKMEYHLIKTIVTTDLQESIAKTNKVKLKNVLTGFKYIAEEIKKLDSSKTKKFLFGGEESYGYLPVSFVRDKDSLTSALLLLEILTEKKDLLAYLDDIYLTYGLYLESLVSLTFEGSQGKKKISDSLEKLRKTSLIGKKIANREIVSFLDYQNKVALGKVKSSAFSGLPKSNVIQIELSGNAKMTIRPSGTEPKVKIYSSFQAIKPPKKRSDIVEEKASLQAEIQRSEKEFLRLAGLDG